MKQYYNYIQATAMATAMAIVMVSVIASGGEGVVAEVVMAVIPRGRVLGYIRFDVCSSSFPSIFNGLWCYVYVRVLP